MKKIILGIDEAGRGPWAGPLVVGGVVVFDEKIFSEIPELTDSKKISEKIREHIFEKLQNLEKLGKIQIFCVFKSAAEIDEFGIREANRQAMGEIIFQFLQKNFSKWENTNFSIKIDGSDNFEFDEKIFIKNFENSENEKNFSKNFQASLFGNWNSEIITKNLEKFSNNSSEEMWRNCEKNFIQFFIGGDASESEISAASIVAKVSRDAYMKRISGDFPEYNFAKNKWYGTRSHHDAILNYGIKKEHRKTFEPIKTLISSQNWL